MSTGVIEPPETEEQEPAKQRAEWRQHLVLIERGLTQGFRADSTFFVHFFVGCALLGAGIVLSLSVTQWLLVVLAVTLVISAEMFLQVLKAIWKRMEHRLDEDDQKILAMGTAAVFVTFLGAGIVVLTILVSRFYHTFLA